MNQKLVSRTLRFQGEITMCHDDLHMRGKLWKIQMWSWKSY